MDDNLMSKSIDDKQNYYVHRLNLLAKTLDFYKTCKTYIHVEINIR